MTPRLTVQTATRADRGERERERERERGKEKRKDGNVEFT
jgi:hypothetical protein